MSDTRYRAILTALGALLLVLICLSARGFTLRNVVTVANIRPGQLGEAAALLPFIDANRLADWQRHVNVGVQGGIPHRTTVYTNFTGDTNGITNERVALNAAISACPTGQVVVLPAGTYNVSGGAITLTRDHVTLRGTTNAQGYPLSRLLDAKISMSEDSPTNSTPTTITAGATKGSSIVTVSSVSAKFAVGSIAVINQITNGYDFISAGFVDAPRMFHTCYVTNISGNDIGIWPPFYVDFTNSPTFDPGFYDGGHFTLVKSGVEDLVIDRNGTSDYALFMSQAVQCWLRNVVVTNCVGKLSDIFTVTGIEIRDSIFTGATGAFANTESLAFSQASGCLIENNIGDDPGAPFIMLAERLPNRSVIGCVVAYNFSTNVDYGNTQMMADLYISHGGGQSWFNLWEGNIAGAIISDGLATASHNTVFRNNFYGTNEGVQLLHGGPGTNVYNCRSIDLKRGSWYHNIVGNILGRSGMEGWYSVAAIPSWGWLTNSIFQLGYANEGNLSLTAGETNPPSLDISAYDKNVTNTVIIHGNYDYINNTVTQVATRSNTLPTSLYLTNTTTAPPQFLTNKTLPIIDAGSPSFVRTNLPALHRWVRWKTGALTP